MRHGHQRIDLCRELDVLRMTYFMKHCIEYSVQVGKTRDPLIAILPTTLPGHPKHLLHKPDHIIKHHSWSSESTLRVSVKDARFLC